MWLPNRNYIICLNRIQADEMGRKQKGTTMRIGVIGGGASGMMAAITAARAGAQVTIIEHTARVGKKILSTGNGKCNFTNQNLSKGDYNGNHPSFAEPALKVFDNQKTLLFFEDCGMAVTCKRDGYYYPHSGQASTLLNVLRFQLDVLNIRIETECYIDTIQKKDGKFYLGGREKKFVFDKLILACGGNAAPATGSDGSGYKLAKMLGHRIVKPLPVLTYVRSKDACLKELAGVRAGAQVSLYVDGTLIQTEEGELQLNKDNVSGIPVFQFSHAAIRALDQKKKVAVVIDFLPHEDIEFLLNKMENHLKIIYNNIPASEVFSAIVNKKVSQAIFRRASVPFDKEMGKLSQKELGRVVSLIKAFPLEVCSYPGFEAAQATMGGVDTNEINPHTMMSEKVEGLYFAGEIMDIDGRCGGYNLQWAWSSGYVAGCHSAAGEVTCYESINVK